MSTTTQLPAEALARIDVEARKFAFFNYVSEAHNPSAKYDEIATWPRDAIISYCSVKNYMSDDRCWPYKEPRLLTEYAGKLHQAQQENEKAQQYFYEQITDCRSKLNDACTLLDKFISRHEAGLPHAHIYNEIKQYLDGTK